MKTNLTMRLALLIATLTLSASAAIDSSSFATRMTMPAAVKGYEVQTSTDPNTPASWVPRDTVAKTSVTIPGSPSGTGVWVRVRAFGSSSQKGPWSDPATKTVP